MRQKSNHIVSVIFLFVVMLMEIIAEIHPVSAANGTVKIFIGDGTSARHHMSMTKGSVSEEFRFELKGYEAKSSTYIGSNPSAFKIINTGNGTCKVEGIAEGTGLLTLTVQTRDGQTLTEKVFISICTKLEQCQAVTQKASDVYRGASTNSDVENTDKKDTISRNVQLTLLSQCGNFYRFQTNDGFVFSDDSNTGFIKKSDVKIPVESVIMQEQNISIETGGSKTFHAKVSPDIASDKSLSWNTGNEKIATVDAAGVVSGISEGTTIISATARDESSQSATTYVSIFKKINAVKGSIKSDTDLYAVGNNKYSIGKGSPGLALTIIGTCGDYYRIKADSHLIPDNYDGYCYILKTKVTVPVEQVKLNSSQISLPAGKKAQLNADIIPTIADNTNVTWSSSNEKIAIVNPKGTVTAKKAGTAIITAASADGTKKAECKILVTESDYAAASKTVNTKPTLTAKSESGDSISLVVSSDEKYDGYVIYINGKKDKEYVSKEGKTDWSSRIFWFYSINETYTVHVKTFVEKNKQRTYSKKSNEQTVTIGKTNINANAVQNKSITVSWEKMKDAKSYNIYRSIKKNGKYELIKTAKENKTSYTDKTVKSKKKYYYQVKPVYNNNVEGSSNKDYATAGKINTAAKYLAKKYKAICTEKNKKINSYYIKGTYPPVKYKFVSGTLQIHVYLEFVTYSYSQKVDSGGVKIYNKKAASVKSAIPTKKYISMFKKGIQEAYEINVKGNKDDFKKGIKFKTKLVIHEKTKKNIKSYNTNQKFIEVLIGGECPNCEFEIPHWYHAGTNYNASGYKEYGNTQLIYMPTNEQVETNTQKGYNTPWKDFGSVAAHELGHILGLADAYYYKGNDRCADNHETGYEYNTKKHYYDNLMKDHFWCQKINANGIEMMLNSIDESTGIPNFASQYFKTYGEKENKKVISKVIKNRKDNQPEKK